MGRPAPSGVWLLASALCVWSVAAHRTSSLSPSVKQRLLMAAREEAEAGIEEGDGVEAASTARGPRGLEEEEEEEEDFGIPAFLDPGRAQREIDRTVQTSSQMTLQPFYHRATRQPDGARITLSTQGDIVRATRRLEVLASRWQGPISFAVLCQRGQCAELDREIKKTVVRQHVDVHLCTSEKKPPYYPINKMRNQALRHIRTDWVFVLDADDDPMFTHLDMSAEVDFAAKQHLPPNPRDAVYALASFQWAGGVPEDEPAPATTAQLAQLLRNKHVTVKAASWARAYTPPTIGVSGWMELTEPEEVGYHDGYEPYFVVRRDAMVEFDERFVGYGGNKAVLALRLALQQRWFVLLPRLFTFDVTPPQDDASRVSHFQLDSHLSDRYCEELGNHFHLTCPRCSYYSCVQDCGGVRKSAVSPNPL